MQSRYTIDPFLFNGMFKAFSNFVKSKSKIEDLSFVSNPYLEESEFYKYEVYNKARENLNFKSWEYSDIGSGKIGKSVLSAIEIKANNLVTWEPRFGESALAHYDLKQAVGNSENLTEFETVFYELYLSQKNEKNFKELIDLFGKRYPLLAYLYFLKDRNRFMPIAPSYFDKGFDMLGVDFKTSHQCSWENYTIYNGLLSDLKLLLEEKINSDVSLLDAHSFIYVTVKNVGDKIDLIEKEKYDNLTEKDREVVSKARIGQGRFREKLLGYWEKCAITECKKESLLIASHIKPWSECTVEEAVDQFNGILLSPTIDTAFDLGLISFKDDGSILISNKLSESDARSLGIESELTLSKIEERHKEYLAYHRKHIFEK